MAEAAALRSLTGRQRPGAAGRLGARPAVGPGGEAIAVATRTTGHIAEEYGGGECAGAPRPGAYPYANSLLVRGTSASLVIDPSLSLVADAPPADLVLVSHAHEDHIAGLGDYDVPVHVHKPTSTRCAPDIPPRAAHRRRYRRAPAGPPAARDRAARAAGGAADGGAASWPFRIGVPENRRR
nr:MBL fold metallo-hydrolase [Streptomyces monomycini]